jgi:GNAT superfamily N-acetyltransferase
MNAGGSGELQVHPLKDDRWGDLELLFGKSGAYSGCWCMFWRLSTTEFAANGNAGNRAALRELTKEKRVPGLLGYRDGNPIGWISLAPREEFGRLQRSPQLKPVDETPVWSIVCFFIDRRHRRTGVASALLRAAVSYAAERGAASLEAYPGEHEPAGTADAAAYMGTVAMFEALGFREVARRAPRRPILRLRL